MSDPCYLNIDDAMLTTTVCGDVYLHSCHACGVVLFSVNRMSRLIKTEGDLLELARSTMREHLGYPPLDHFEAMGL